MIFKTFKELTPVPYTCIIVLAIVQDCVRPYETVQDRVRQYIQQHMKSTPRVNSTVSILYINGMESNSKESRWDGM